MSWQLSTVTLGTSPPMASPPSCRAACSLTKRAQLLCCLNAAASGSAVRKACCATGGPAARPPSGASLLGQRVHIMACQTSPTCCLWGKGLPLLQTCEGCLVLDTSLEPTHGCYDFPLLNARLNCCWRAIAHAQQRAREKERGREVPA